MDLTARQAEVLDFIRRFVKTEGYPPTIREIATHLHVNIGAVQGHLEALSRKGALVRAPGIPRAIRVLEPDPAAGAGRSEASGKLADPPAAERTTQERSAQRV